MAAQLTSMNGPAHPRAALMQDARHQPLARAGLPLQEDGGDQADCRRIEAGQMTDLGAEGLEGGSLADETVRWVTGGNRLGTGHGLSFGARGRQMHQQASSTCIGGIRLCERQWDEASARRSGGMRLGAVRPPYAHNWVLTQLWVCIVGYLCSGVKNNLS